MRNQPPKKTNRIEKVSSLIEHALGPILHEELGSEFGIITISKVETSRDMKWAKIWISMLSANPKQPREELNPPVQLDASGRKKKGVFTPDDKVMKAITDNIYNIQGELNKHFHTKVIPRLQFFLDTSPRYVQHIDELIREVHEEDKK